jgi:hypothetical protein
VPGAAAGRSLTSRTKHDAPECRTRWHYFANALRNGIDGRARRGPCAIPRSPAAAPGTRVCRIGAVSTAPLAHAKSVLPRHGGPFAQQLFRRSRRNFHRLCARRRVGVAHWRDGGGEFRQGAVFQATPDHPGSVFRSILRSVIQSQEATDRHDPNDRLAPRLTAEVGTRFPSPGLPFRTPS